ncbi:MAG TPA: ADOP family duplicated permease [Gemmatimonadaceae bacterium]|nr:ADOP family duplicated permease [Gemmatimonadaceae bacterium]
MSFIDATRHRLRLLFRRGRLAQEMDDEIRFHLDLEAMHQDASDRGHAARRRFGNVSAIREDRRRETGLAVLDRVRQDAAYALRQLTRAPGFTFAVVLTLALGIGANATMFAIVDRVMLRAPEGIADAGRVVQLRSWTEGRNGLRDSSTAHAYPSYMEFRAMTDVFESVTAVRGPQDIPVDRGPGATNARGALVSDHYFETLGIRPALGRFFSVDETHEPDGAPVAVLGHAYWQRHFAGAADAVGRTLLAGNTRYTIIGVAPAGFAGHTLSQIDFWLPIASTPEFRWGATGWYTDRGTRWLTVYARLRRDVSPERALARAGVGWTAWRVRPDQRVPRPYFVSTIPAENNRLPEHRVARLLTGVAVLLLLITCANVANLLLARALSRRREIAIRLALGVRRARLTLLLLIDALLLALLGGTAALAVAWAGIPVVRAILFAGTRTGGWTIDGRVIAFTMLTALAAGLLAGIVPALQASRPSLIGALRQGAREGVVHRSRTRLILLVAQGALSVALLAGTGLFVRSLQRIGEQHLGLDLHRVLVADFHNRRSGLTPEQVREVYFTMRERALAIPGVESASLSVGVPFEGQYGLPLRIPGHDSIPGMPRGHAPFIYAVTPDIFRTLGTRIIAGRPLTEADDRTDAPAVAVVTAQMARLLWPDVDPIGQCFKIELRSPTPDCTQVVGITEDTRREALLETTPPALYWVPLAQAPRPLSELTLLVRAASIERVRAALGRVAQNIRPDMPYVHVRTLEDAVAPELRPWRLGAAVFALFGALALVVAALGTYSVMQFSLSQRLHELGVRIALGARRGHLVRMVTSEALRIGALAAAAGIAMVLVTGPLVASLLFETSPRDPLVLAAVVLVLLLSGVLATLVPAWRAARVDPVTTLKTE